MQRLEIGELLIEINTDYESDMKINSFHSAPDKMPDAYFSFEAEPYLPWPEGHILIEDKIKWYRNQKDGTELTVCIPGRESQEAESCMSVDRLWKNIRVSCRKKNYGNHLLEGPLGEIFFRNRLLFHQGIMIHASAIAWQGRGIIFSAPSGTGKSTQAENWERWMDAETINGDRSVLRVEDPSTYVYGSPWCGSSNRYLNKKVPLKAIVILEQAEENEIRLMNAAEALVRLLPRCFLPYFDEEGSLMAKALETVEKIISMTKVYLLKCKPDKEAVEMVWQCVK